MNKNAKKKMLVIIHFLYIAHFWIWQNQKHLEVFFLQECKERFLDLKHVSGSVKKQTDECFSNHYSTLYNLSSSCCLIIFTVISQSELYFIFCSAFTVTTAAPSLPHAPTAFPSIVHAYRPVSSILQCPDVLLSLLISLYSAFLLSHLRSIGLHGSSAGYFGPSGLCTHCPRTELGLAWPK